MLTMFFKAVGQTLLTFGENKLGGKLNFIATLHTWDQKPNAHFHLHCLVAGEALCEDDSRWQHCKSKYLINARALSLVIRGKFIAHLKKACERGHLNITGDELSRLGSRLYEKPWVIDVREPVKNPEHVLEYLARYTYRMAIANSRIKTLRDGMVTFYALKKNRLNWGR